MPKSKKSKALMLMSPKTYVRVKDDFLLLYTDEDGNNIKIMPQLEASAAEGYGYLFVDGHYAATYDLREKKTKDAEASNRKVPAGSGNPSGIPH